MIIISPLLLISQHNKKNELSLPDIGCGREEVWQSDVTWPYVNIPYLAMAEIISTYHLVKVWAKVRLPDQESRHFAKMMIAIYEEEIVATRSEIELWYLLVVESSPSYDYITEMDTQSIFWQDFIMVERQ